MEDKVITLKSWSIFIIKFLEKGSIFSVWPCFTPINYQDHLIKKYNRFKKEDCPNANTLMETGFYLPSGNLIPNEDIDFVCEEIIKHSKK